MLDAFNITYLVGDARNISVPENSFDLIVSNNTFEHIYPDIFKSILSEFKRVAKKDGMMSHFIDMSDHFAHFDQSISIYNFLQYSGSAWKMIDNDIQPQNRMRLRQYEDIYNELGIPYVEWKLRLGEPDKIKAMKLAEPFNIFSPEENAISHGYMISHFGDGTF